MKTTMMALIVAAVAAGTAWGEESNGCGEQPKGCPWANKQGEKSAWSPGEERGHHPGGPMDHEMMGLMKANHKAIRELGEAARAETDPAKKEEIVAQLRTKLGEVNDLMQKKWEERLAQAEERISDLREKVEYSKANRDELIEEHVQRILSGEKPQRPDRFKDFPNAKGGHLPPPPPLGDEEEGDLPPPEE